MNGLGGFISKPASLKKRSWVTIHCFGWTVYFINYKHCRQRCRRKFPISLRISIDFVWKSDLLRVGSKNSRVSIAPCPACLLFCTLAFILKQALSPAKSEIEFVTWQNCSRYYAQLSGRKSVFHDRGYLINDRGTHGFRWFYNQMGSGRGKNRPTRQYSTFPSMKLTVWIDIRYLERKVIGFLFVIVLLPSKWWRPYFYMPQKDR